ncbi:hypothetical protein SAMN04487846_0515 [Microbacterium sp. cf046]|uniref:hypothetical protein n=1 Tax=Microbacterium sp. cf046 TaxID=1761803 RepID=UPI0008E02CB3|nr:hypothetical protein [Microbacterium sp. cf046]SFR91091.1 hypothetical protein SAMN04487846_0515 [Microbacterium sp. cf046]
MTLPRRLLALPVALLLAGGALAGCATPAASAPSSSPSASEGAEVEIDAAWLDDGRIIGLVTVGSSTCIPAADDATLQADGSLAVTLVEPDADTACTRDMVPRVTLVEVPEGVDPSEDLAITVSGDGYSGSAELEGVEGLVGGGMTDYLPSAGWTETDGQFVLLTWGSSSCVPVISEVSASGPAEVTVTFETPAADQVCTMDMGPRASVAVVDGLEEDSDVSLVLAGSPEFDNVRIPIYGSN